MAGRVAVLDTFSEARRYLGFGPARDDFVVSPSPAVRRLLSEHGVSAHGTVRHFTASDHRRGLLWSLGMEAWLAAREPVCRGEGSGAVQDTLAWHTAFFARYLWYLLAVALSVCRVYPEAEILSAGPPEYASAWAMGPDEGYGGTVTALAAGAPGRKLVSMAGDEPAGQEWKAEALPPCLRPEGPVGAWARKRLASIYLARAARGRSRTRVLLPTEAYGMHGIAREAAERDKGLEFIALDPSYRRLTTLKAVAALGRALADLKSDRDGLVPHRLDLVAGASLDREDDCLALRENIRAFADRVEAEESIFSHDGVSFAKAVADRIRHAMANPLLVLSRQMWALGRYLDAVEPDLAAAPYSREFTFGVGELGAARGMPTLMCSHGTFAPSDDEPVRRHWAAHGRGLMHTVFSNSLLQTPQAEAYAGQLEDCPTVFHRTGPVVWGQRTGKEKGRVLARRLFGRDVEFVVMHAGSAKPRNAVHFWVYETPDEYLRAIRDLSRAVARVEGAGLLVRFRPSPHIQPEDMAEAAGLGDHVALSWEGPFSDVIGAADLLASLSSTTIEEALLNNIPVLEYGGTGPYVHLPGSNAARDDCEASAVYTVGSEDDLPQALERIIRLERSAGAEDRFAPYRYPEERVRSFGQVVRDLAQGRT